MENLYVYKNGAPCGIIDNIDQKTIGEIDRISRELSVQGKEGYLKPLHPNDFVFDEKTGQKMWAKIEKYEHPDFDTGPIHIGEAIIKKNPEKGKGEW